MRLFFVFIHLPPNYIVDFCFTKWLISYTSHSDKLIRISVEGRIRSENIAIAMNRSGFPVEKLNYTFSENMFCIMAY